MTEFDPARAADSQMLRGVLRYLRLVALTFDEKDWPISVLDELRRLIAQVEPVGATPEEHRATELVIDARLAEFARLMFKDAERRGRLKAGALARLIGLGLHTGSRRSRFSETRSRQSACESGTQAD